MPYDNQLLLDPTVSPIALLKMLLQHFGKEVLVEDFEAAITSITEKFVRPHELVQEKIRALRVCNATGAPWTRFEVFSPVVHAFNAISVDFNMHTHLDAHELGLGVYVMNKVRTESYEDDTPRYVAAQLMYAGLHYPPIPELSFARKFIRPYNAGAEATFLITRDTPIEDVEINDSHNEGVQAILGRAELESFRETVSKWAVQEANVGE